jgi:hypothetical protein
MKLQIFIATGLIAGLIAGAPLSGLQSAEAQSTPTAPTPAVTQSAAPNIDEDSPTHPCHHERTTICHGMTWGKGAGKCLSDNYAQLGELCKARIDQFRTKHPHVK